ncbi:LAFE_0C13366g1_1 [Lachancea fermentati]|uniref:LAFE_0C13366g1_1 n=1 Tax=Lachancea fermentati TaxID=4955 RepID=A0A1G4MAD9_LACFM|nr:LAFE_0C13366g1_1 [Lachancea fermentati]
MGLKVVVIGANGRVGRILCAQLKANDKFDTPLAIVRTSEQVQYFENQVGVYASLTNIEDSNIDEIADVLEGYDAVVWTAGAGGKGIERIFTVDLDGAMKVIEACEAADVKRFVMVSAINAEHREFWWHTALRNYYIAKRTSDFVLRHSSLDYTILQPGSLLSGEGTGKLCPEDRVQETRSNHYQIEREDVASVIVECLANPAKTVKKTISLANGDQPISEFIHTL